MRPLLILVAALAPSAVLAQQVPAEANRAWESYAREMRKVSVRIRTESTHRDRGKVISSGVRDQIVRATPRGLIIEQSDSSGEPRNPEKQYWKLEVVNQKYEFTGSRAAGSTAWSLTGVTRPDVLKAMPGGGITTRDAIEADSNLVGLAVDRVLIDRLLTHRSCRVDSSQRIVRNGQNRYEVNFAIDVEKKIAKSRDLVGGTVVLDPSNHWLLDASELRLKNGNEGISTVRTTYKYTPGETGLPVPAEVEFKLTTDDGSYVAEGKSTFEWLGPTKLNDADFTLRAFGFPEHLTDIGTALAGAAGDTLQTQTDPSEGGNGPWYVPVFFSAIGLVVVGLILRYAIIRRGANRT
ncbi:hypothetical protein [Frigoriglobus tundricola]|uniref:Uncharacterized protein n=1 Tax=Frigoriglobus tundricola TaxID=2774151 RepID=A0A6M5Z2N6_9BACT|nr:hypothetical protein [Frigoriglobus tundricola]QJW99452.1 hypothetical protein FTUN_7064 [Frigoriglobus tundricola]